MGEDSVGILLANAIVVVERLFARLGDACEALAEVGEISRRSTYVRTITLVAVPKPMRDMFGEPIEGMSQLEQVILQMVEDGSISRPIRGVGLRGSAYLRFVETKSQLVVTLCEFPTPEALNADRMEGEEWLRFTASGG